MKERPILFSGAMVRALLDGSKTQTRRVVTPAANQQWLQPETLNQSPRAKPCLIRGEQWAQFAHPLAGQTINGIKHDEWSPLTCIRSPYGQPGDRLWVRENFYRVDSKGETEVLGRMVPCDKQTISFVADNLETPPGRQYPSIHMPRWASRINLEITGVRVERLQDISDQDARAEGIDACDGISTTEAILDLAKRMGAPKENVLRYATLWESINGAGSWEANPWVWAIEFRRIA